MSDGSIKPQYMANRPVYMRWFLPLASGFFVVFIVFSIITGGKVVASYAPVQLAPTGDVTLTNEMKKGAKLQYDLNALRSLALQKREECKELPFSSLEKPAAFAVLPGNEIKLPSNSGSSDVSFIQGCWNSDAGLSDSVTNNPVIVKYCFDSAGNGSRSIFHASYVCTGTAIAAMRENGELVIKDMEKATCSGQVSKSYNPYTTVCQNDGNGKVRCLMQNLKDKENKLTTKFTRAG